MRAHLILVLSAALFGTAVLLSSRDELGPLREPGVWTHSLAAAALVAGLLLAREEERRSLVLPLRVAAAALAALVLATILASTSLTSAGPAPFGTLWLAAIFALPETLILAATTASWSNPGGADRWMVFGAWGLGLAALFLLSTCFGAALGVAAGAGGAALAASLLARAGLRRDRKALGLALIATGGGALSVAVLLMVATRPIVC